MVVHELRSNVALGRALRRVAIALLLLVNSVLLVVALHGVFFVANPPDWQGLVDAAHRISGGLNPYAEQTFAFRWSPLAAWALVPFAAAGLVVWQLLHVGALLALPSRIALLCVACFAFWVDVGMGNLVVFGFVLAYRAISGDRWAVAAFVAFALVVPRPLYIPVLVWLWLRQPDERRLMIVSGVVVIALTLATGLTQAWLTVLVASGADVANTTNLGPSRLIGLAYVPIGLVAAVWALRRGRVGLSSVLISPYWLPYYMLMLLLDVRPRAGSWRAGITVGWMPAAGPATDQVVAPVEVRDKAPGWA